MNAIRGARRSRWIWPALLLAAVSAAQAQTKVMFSASLEVPCLVRLVGAGQSEFLLNAAQAEALMVPGQDYRIKIRFGRVGAFSYAVTDAFKMPAVAGNEAARVSVRKDEVQVQVQEKGERTETTIRKESNGKFSVTISSRTLKTSADRTLPLTASTPDEFGLDRLWTDTEGKQVRASFLQRNETEVVLLGANKQVFRIPVGRFSEADRAYLSRLGAMPAAAP